MQVCCSSDPQRLSQICRPVLEAVAATSRLRRDTLTETMQDDGDEKRARIARI